MSREPPGASVVRARVFWTLAVMSAGVGEEAEESEDTKKELPQVRARRRVEEKMKA